MHQMTKKSLCKTPSEQTHHRAHNIMHEKIKKAFVIESLQKSEPINKRNIRFMHIIQPYNETMKNDMAHVCIEQ